MSTLVAQTISNGTVSTSSANVIQGSAKAWVNFNGANGSIRASYNVSSVSRTATGQYTINFTNAFADANYAVTGFAQKNSLDDANPLILSANSQYTYSTSAIRIKTVVGSWSFQDGLNVGVAIFR